MRDFESQPFEVTCGPDCRLHIVGNPTTRSVELKTRRGKRTNRDGKDDVAIAFLKAHPELSVRDAATQLKEMGIKGRGKDWVSNKLRELSGTGVVSLKRHNLSVRSHTTPKGCERRRMGQECLSVWFP